MKKNKYHIIIIVLAVVLAAVVLAYPLIARNGNATNTGSNNPSGSGSQGKQAPDFTALDMEGNKVSLSDYIGKPIVVNFWATWCGPCKMELPAFENAYNEYGEEVTFLMVNMTDGERDTEGSVKAFIEDNGYTFPVFFDTKFSAASAYNVTGIPMTLYINADGTLADSHVGMIQEKALVKAIEELLK